MRKLLLVFIVLAAISSGFGQVSSVDTKPDTRKKSSLGRSVLTPVILISAGLLATTDNEVFDKWEVKELRDRTAPHFSTTVDDYLQYSPLIATLALKAAGVQSKHDWANLSLLIVKSEIFMTAIVVPTKQLTAITRPDGGSHSFPSGHTAEAFAAATILHKEFGKDHPWISVLGYATASGVGVLRIMNGRHWVSDVLAGAGVGILATNLAYLTHRYKWTKKPVLSNLDISPSWTQKAVGLNLVLHVRYRHS